MILFNSEGDSSLVRVSITSGRFQTKVGTSNMLLHVFGLVFLACNLRASLTLEYDITAIIIHIYAQRNSFLYMFNSICIDDIIQGKFLAQLTDSFEMWRSLKYLEKTVTNQNYFEEKIKR
jgi:hypothetical protein